MSDFEVHEYMLGSPAASILGIADRLLERKDLDADVAAHIRAMRDLALEIVRESERAPAQPRH
jgi:hypothetical protein